MNKAIFAGLIVVGVGLLLFGLTAADSFGSDVSRFFTGSPTDKAIWMILGGIGTAAAGVVGLFFAGKRA